MQQRTAAYRLCPFKIPLKLNRLWGLRGQASSIPRREGHSVMSSTPGRLAHWPRPLKCRVVCHSRPQLKVDPLLETLHLAP